MTDNKPKIDPVQIAKGFVIIISIIVGGGWWLWSAIFPKIATPPPDSASHVTIGNIGTEAPCTTVLGYFAATSEDLLDRVNMMSLNKDTEAAAKLMAQYEGSIIILKGGDEVYVEDRKVFAGKVKIRAKGLTETLWTVAEAVNCP